MTKIMLVEDDNNLREIYEARLLAEGYEIVSAKDGEEALAMAVKEKPDLIISDVMMPKISGFDMLDILRSTPETKDTKVIMMTALSQNEDKARADKLGADRYLVKSQVTLEDVARVAREVLSGEEAPAEPAKEEAPDPTPAAPAEPITVEAPAAPQQSTSSDPEPATDSATIPAGVPDSSSTSTTPAADPIAAPDPATQPDTVPTPAADAASATQIDPALASSLIEEEKAVDAQIDNFAAKPAPEPPKEATEAGGATLSVKEAPAEAGENNAKESELADAINNLVKETEPAPEVSSEPSTPDAAADGSVPIAHKKVIEPISTGEEKSDLNELAAKEEQKDAVSPVATAATPPVASVVQPGGATVTPATSGGSAGTDQPGNVITPTGGASPDTSGTPADLAL